MDKNKTEKASFYKRFPSSIRFGILSGVTTSVVTTLLVGLFAIIATVLESRENIFTYSFQNSFIPYFFTIQIIFILFWIAIAMILSVFLVSQHGNATQKKLIFITNIIASFFSYFLTSVPLILLFIVLDTLIKYLFKK